MILAKFFLSVLLICRIAIDSCSQTIPGNELTTSEVFVGSTPCNSLIKSLLKISSSEYCEFIKWELSISDSEKDSSFKLFISYGAFQPNTMNFLGGGHKINMFGKLTTSIVMYANSRHKVYHLIGSKGESELLLIKMDNNILHFVDSNMKFIEGDSSFGFVLNRNKSELR